MTDIGNLAKEADQKLWLIVDLLDERDVPFAYRDYLESIVEAVAELQKRVWVEDVDANAQALSEWCARTGAKPGGFP